MGEVLSISIAVSSIVVVAVITIQHLESVTKGIFSNNAKATGNTVNPTIP